MNLSTSSPDQADNEARPLPLPVQGTIDGVAVEARSLNHMCFLAVAILLAVSSVWRDESAI